MDSQQYREILHHQVIMMCGVSGSGKTYFSKNLEKDYGYHRLSIDEYIWDIYGESFNSIPFGQKKAIFADAAEKIEIQLIEKIKDGEKVVLDSTMCKRIKRDRIRSLCESNNVTPIFLYLKASLPLLSNRLKQRKGTDANDQIVTEEQLQMFFSNFESPDEDENFITIEHV